MIRYVSYVVKAHAYALETIMALYKGIASHFSGMKHPSCLVLCSASSQQVSYTLNSSFRVLQYGIEPWTKIIAGT